MGLFPSNHESITSNHVFITFKLDSFY